MWRADIDRMCSHLRESEERPRDIAVRGEEEEASERLSAILLLSMIATRCRSTSLLALLTPQFSLSGSWYKAVDDCDDDPELIATDGSSRHRDLNAIAVSIP